MDTDKLRLYIVGVFLGFCVLGWLVVEFYASRPSRPSMGETSEKEPDYSDLSDPRWSDATENLILSRPDEALSLLRKLLAGSSSAAERDRIQKKMPRSLWEAYKRRVGEERYAEAEALQSELQRSYKGAQEQGYTAKDWAAARRRWASKAASSGDWSLAERLLSEGLAEGDEGVSSSRETWEMYGLHRLGLWRRAREAGDQAAADVDLQAAANVFAGSGAADPVSLALSERMGLDELVARGALWMIPGSYAVALAHFKAAERIAKRGPGGSVIPAGKDEASPRSKEEIDRIAVRLDAARLALSRERRLGQSRWLGLEDAERLVQQAVYDAEGRVWGAPPDAGAQRLEDVLKSYRELTEVLLARFDRMCQAGDFAAAESLARRVLQDHASKILSHRCRLPEFDVFAGLPAEVRERIQKDQPAAEVSAHVAALAKLVSEGLYSPRLPETEAMRSRVPNLYARWCRSLMGSDRPEEREKAYELARMVLRRYPGEPPTLRLVEDLREALRQAGARRHFDRLVDLAGLYVAEVGATGVQDAFGADLKGLLHEGAEHFRSASSMKRLFLLTLMADAFSLEREGQEARDEATRSAFDIISQSQPQEMAEPELALPSTVPEHSVECIENGTSDHLLAFFQGPEQFYVRINPGRRGTVVLKDGHYVSAVVVARDTVRPYRGERTYASQTLQTKYYIATSGSRDGRRLEENADARGDYKLLRAPRGLGPLKVDPRTCLVTGSR